MKASRYNHFLLAGNGIGLAYNCLSGALIEIEPENYDRVRGLVGRPEEASNDEDRLFIHYLSEGGFLIDDGVDEIDRLEEQSRIRRRQKGTMTLTVAPTLACNFSCDYCFVDRSAARMDNNVQDHLVRFVEGRLPETDKLRVSWFGGEPTLCFSIVEKLQRKFNEAADHHDCEMSQVSVVTNGYLLDYKMGRRLRSLGCDLVQVTIDGPKRVHDARRKLSNGRGTFDTILNNLEQVCDLLTVRVRINIDQGNADTAAELIDELEDRGLLPKIKVYFAQVQSAGEICASASERCFDPRDFAQSLVQLHRYLIDRGHYRVESPRIIGGVYCGALTDNCYAVAPTGHWFRCRDRLSINPDNSNGDIFGTRPTEKQKSNTQKFKSWDPFRLDECRRCDILPLCMGGCPLQSESGREGSKTLCSPLKYNLADMLRLRYECESANREKQA